MPCMQPCGVVGSASNRHRGLVEKRRSHIVQLTQPKIGGSIPPGVFFVCQIYLKRGGTTIIQEEHKQTKVPTGYKKKMNIHTIHRGEKENNEVDYESKPTHQKNNWTMLIGSFANKPKVPP